MASAFRAKQQSAPGDGRLLPCIGSSGEGAPDPAVVN